MDTPVTNIESHYMDPWEFRRIFQQLKCFGKTSAPRGIKILELENFSWTFPAYVRWCNFEARKLSLDYIKAELRWYLYGDPGDQTIDQHASTWAKLRDHRGEVNSNYGHYIFRRGQFLWCVTQLRLDPDSRRASMVILKSDHLHFMNKDVPCTYGLNFRIRNEKLNASVHMRSQDAIWGLGNDLPFFSIVQEMLAAKLKIDVGTLHLSVDSFHVYERHFEMFEQLWSPVKGSLWHPIECPRIYAHEVDGLLSGDLDESPFTIWLYGLAEIRNRRKQLACDPASTKLGSTLHTSSLDKGPVDVAE